MPKNIADLVTIRAFITSVSDEVKYKRKDKTHTKMIVGFETVDRQKLYVEFRDRHIKRFRELQLDIADQLELSILFNGNQKGPYHFNNLVVYAFNYVQ